MVETTNQSSSNGFFLDFHGSKMSPVPIRKAKWHKSTMFGDGLYMFIPSLKEPKF
jgi:hypothetical protein